MRYREIPATGAARKFVACYWMLEDDSEGQVQRIVPDGRPEVIVHLGRSYESFSRGQWSAQPRAAFAGQLTGPLLLRSRGKARVFGARLHPHGAHHLLRAPLPELADSVTSLSDLSKPLARLADGPQDFSELIAEFEAIVPEADPDRFVAQAVAEMTATGGQVEIAALAAQGGVSCRQFERRFLSRVGMPPKVFCRIQRFRRVMAAIDAPGSNWVDAAIDCGYYDQSHLIRDFKDLSGKPPSLLLAEADFARHFVDPVSHFSKTAPARLR